MRAFLYLFFLSVYGMYGQWVGVNTTDPQQALHVGGTTGTIRIENLNAANSDFNGGDVDLDGDLTNNIFPLYVDDNGDFTLEYKPLYNSEDLDALNDASLPTSSVYLLPTNTDGNKYTNIVTYTITVNRPVILAVKYNISYDIYFNNTHKVIDDNLSRRIDTFIRVVGDSRSYGAARKSYSSGSVNSVTGTFYNFSKSYISLPASGEYTIQLVGGVSSELNVSSATAYTLSAYVEFATGDDFVFFRLY